jgi:hypothetical protein
MATRSDLLLYQALTGLGQGLGSHFGRRRQNKQNEQFAQAFLGPESTPQDFVDPRSMELAGKIMGGGPGLGGAIAGFGTQTGLAARANEQAQAANQKRAQLAEMFKDPQMAALMKQGIAQAKVAEMMPQKAKPPIALGKNRYAKWNTKTKQYDIVENQAEKDPQDRYLEIDLGGGKKQYYDTWGQPGESGKFPLAFEGDRPPVQKEVGFGDNQKRMGAFTPEGQLIDWMGEPYEHGKTEVTTRDATSLNPRSVGDIQSQLLSIQGTRQNYQNIMDVAKPEYLELLYKNAWHPIRGIILSLGGKGVLSDKQIAEHGEAAVFYQNTWKSVNEYIKAITGAQMSEKEVPRLMNSIANISDDPVAFFAKLNNSMEIADQVAKKMEAHLADNKILDVQVYNETIDQWGDRYKNATPEDQAKIEAHAREVAAGKWAARQIEAGWVNAGLTPAGGGEELPTGVTEIP